MTDERRLKISARLEHIETACDFVGEAATRAGLDDDGVHHCRLSVEEVCTNVIEHGYTDYDNGDNEIEVICTSRGDSFHIVILDNAPLFNPLALPDPDPSTPLWERQGGGWGVFFVKRFMDAVRYDVVNGRNQLTIQKRM